MKLATFLLPLLLLVAAALARPAEPDAVADSDAAHVAGLPSLRLPEGALLEADSVLARERRSPEEKQRGSVSGSVHREKGVGTVVQAQGQGNIWTSKKGNAQVDAHGQWSKVVNGPARGKPNYNAGIRFTARF
ncbi:hypothetical protein R5R35_012864 [Gryllus longicercus]|uniref:Attacin C-terminal domain-containing protein n=1 Tax=Gryllus longicercus TaxID=2509291 RepID=A0AAN9ZC50_9ORTH